jgi:hypothetical protein
VVAVAALLCGVLSAWSSSPATTKVLLVGTYNGVPGQYTTIQSAVDAANAGDWILVGPGDYHETADEAGPPVNPQQGQMGGVYINKSGITLRGMNRNSVIVDGTNPGATACSSAPADQNYGALGSDGNPVGRNGILIWEANDVTVDNLTVCNFMAGTGASGNQVWWNGGDGSGQIGLSGYWGSYLTATSSFLGNETTAAEYGIFASNAAGPATLNQLYANNMNDSGTYVGACLQQCNVILNHLWMENNALGYSGTNSGGRIVIKNSQFDNNQDGLDTNTQVIGDPPAPQNGACPGGGVSAITHTHSCWVFIHNYVHDNNNPYTPAAGSAAAGPIGTGMTISGGRTDTVMDNTFANNGAWGILFVPYAQSGKPSLGQTCVGSGGHKVPGFGCVLDPEGDALLNNTFSNNGYFANPSNSDFGQITFFGGEPQNCYSGNVAPDGSHPSNLEATQQVCGVTTTAGKTGGSLLGQVLCDTRLAGCPPGANYPTPNGTVVLQPVPQNLPTMPNPCAGVPANPWCPGGGAAPAAPTGRNLSVAAVGVLGLLAVAPARKRRSAR